MCNEDFQSIYQKGLNCYFNGDFDKASKYLLLVSNNPIYRKRALDLLSIIEISRSNFLKARAILEENKDILYYEYALNYGILDLKEYNYQRSLNEITDSFKTPFQHLKKLMVLADYYIQLGEYDLAIKIFETLQNSDYYIKATLKLIYLYILLKDFKYANKLFKKISQKDIPQYFYERLNDLLLYFNNKLNHENNKQYFITRLVNDNNQDLIMHLKKHIGNRNARNYSYFFEDINILDILKEVQKQIENLNPMIDNDTCNYNLTLPNTIGYSNDNLTKNLKVVTIIGTKKIITMYPILVSNEFNLEGNIENKELMYKRNRGIYHE